MATNLTATEREVIYLRTITDLIDEMVNKEMFEVLGPTDSNILFRTMTHKTFFQVLLIDLLSKCDKDLVGEEQSYLDALDGICRQPSFDRHGSITDLKNVVEKFWAWLDFEAKVSIWFPSLNSTIELMIPRRMLVKICGNFSKHSILRRSQPARHVRVLLEKAGHTISLSDTVQALEEFHETIDDNVLSYHSSTVAEFLNDIRWGIHDYLVPEWNRSYTPANDESHPPSYSYQYPAQIINDLAKTLYWDLMNDVRRGPIFERFRVTKYLKGRY